MSRLCVRPGCSEVGAAEYGMVPEDLLFWIAPAASVLRDGSNVLCLRHADAMSVPRGWTLDDRREEVPRLFAPRRFASEVDGATTPRNRRRRKSASQQDVEQLQIDGTGEIPRPAIELVAAITGGTVDAVDTVEQALEPVEPAAPWRPEFDNDDDLDGLLEVSSPLLARAFRGTGRPRA